jgi:hypothetical protein
VGTDNDEVGESLVEPKPPKKKGATKKVVKKVAKKAAKKANGNGAKREAVKEEGIVTILDLAAEAGITAQAVRIKLRGSDIERGEGRWKFEDGSKRLKQVRQLLGIGA